MVPFLRRLLASAVTALVAVLAALVVQAAVQEHVDRLVRYLAPSQLLAQMGVAQVLVLRLAREANRSDDLVRQASQLHVPLDFVEATDGLAEESRSRPLPTWVPEATCSDFSGATFATHERAWALAASSDGPTLVLEDVARLTPGLANQLAERLQALPKYDLALAGSAVARSRSLSESPELLSVPRRESREVAFRGLWAYVVSPRGARKLLHLAREARGCEAGLAARRVFEPVDRFVAGRLRRLRVFAMEPPPALAAEFALDRASAEHVGGGGGPYRQVGIVRVARLPSLSLNGSEDDAEAAAMRRTLARVAELGDQRRSAEAIIEAEAAFRRMRQYSCWGAALLLGSAGAAMLQLLWADPERTGDAVEGRRMLLLAIEALSSSVRYGEGTHDRQRREQYQALVREALEERQKRGLPELDLPHRKEFAGGWLDAKAMALVEWLPNNTAEAAAPACLEPE